MKPLQLARVECANFQSDGSCLGVVISDKVELVSCSPKPKCVLNNCGNEARCRYFETCVLPLTDMIREPNSAKDFQSARAKYYDLTNQLPPSDRFCECGQPLQKRMRLCPDCQRKHRRASYRKNKGLDSTVKQNSDQNSLAKTDIFEPFSGGA